MDDSRSPLYLQLRANLPLPSPNHRPASFSLERGVPVYGHLDSCRYVKIDKDNDGQHSFEIDRGASLCVPMSYMDLSLYSQYFLSPQLAGARLRVTGHWTRNVDYEGRAGGLASFSVPLGERSPKFETVHNYTDYMWSEFDGNPLRMCSTALDFTKNYYFDLIRDDTPRPRLRFVSPCDIFHPTSHWNLLAELEPKFFANFVNVLMHEPNWNTDFYFCT